MNSPFIYVDTAYDIEKIVRYSDPPIFDNLAASGLSDLVRLVWVQHFHALNAQDIPQNTVRDKSKQNRTKSNILSMKPLCRLTDLLVYEELWLEHTKPHNLDHPRYERFEILSTWPRSEILHQFRSGALPADICRFCWTFFAWSSSSGCFPRSLIQPTPENFDGMRTFRTTSSKGIRPNSNQNIRRMNIVSDGCVCWPIEANCLWPSDSLLDEICCIRRALLSNTQSQLTLADVPKSNNIDRIHA